MPRWYMGFYCFGNPQGIVDQVAARVSARHLGQLVPVARVERMARRGQGQFYLFLGIDSAEFGKLPSEVQSGLLDLPLPSLPSPLPYAFKFEEIGGMVSGELDVRDYATRIAYWRPSEAPEQDPFAAGGRSVEAERVPKERVAAYDRFLKWLSAVGSGTWEVFREACQVCLGEREDVVSAARTMRQFRLLGHIEMSSDGKRWSIAPPVLALATDPVDGHYAFLCGQHNPAIIAILDREDKHELLPSDGGNGPQLIRWRDGAGALTAAQAITSEQTYPVVVGGNVALRLAQALPSIEDWVGLQSAVQGVVPELYRVKRFNGEDFTDVHFDARSGMYQFWPLEHPEQKRTDSRPILTAFYDAPRNRWLRGDWYGLRFLTRLTNGEACPARYDVEAGCLAVPSDWRWPELYERALVLASGRLPERRGGWLCYSAITQQVQEALAEKLHIQLKEGYPDA